MGWAHLGWYGNGNGNGNSNDNSNDNSKYGDPFDCVAHKVP